MAEKQKSDVYSRQLRESHAKRFEKYVNSLPLKLRERLSIKKLYAAIGKDFNIYRLYNVHIREFTLAMLQDKLHMIEMEVDHSDPYGMEREDNYVS